MKAKKIFLTAISLMLVLSMLFTLVACIPNDGNEVEVTSVDLDRASLALEIGGSATLSVIVLPLNATNQTARWLSSDTSVATVDGNGVVTAVGAGTALVRATVGGKSATCNVTVTDPSAQTVYVTGVSLDKQSLQLDADKGEFAQLTATVTPENASYKTVTWSSNNTSVATVSANGLVTAVANGTAIVTVTAYREAGSTITYTASCVVQVTGSNNDVGSSLYVAKVSSLENRTQEFIMGMDASAVPSIEEARKAYGEPLYKNFDGEEEDVFKILKDNGITDIRIRIWNDPTDSNGNTYGGGNCDVDNAVAIAARCEAVGLGVIIDFHYSDFWADPGKQTIPKAWKSYSTSQVENAIYEFTKDSLEKVAATGVKITMVQVGNETNSGMAGSNDWTVICKYMNAGSKAVREVTGTVANGGAKVAVHFTNPEAGNYRSRAQTLASNNVDYDVFGSSYYPFWHGTLSNLSAQLKAVHDTYGKEVMVLETSYAFTYEDADGAGNTAIDVTTQPVTVQGQANAVRSVIETVAALGDYGLGVCYWEGTWISASTSTNGARNRNICKEYGCGWATSFAKGYDSSANDGGCVVDNQAFWLSDGTPLESLQVFKLVYTGQTGDIKADLLNDQEDYYTVGIGAINLPATVTVTLNNGSVMEVAAYWAVTPEQLEDYINTVGMHTITGTTDFGGTCYFYAWVMNPNLLVAGSFEDDEGVKGYGSTDNFIQPESELAGWKLTYNKATSALQLYASTDSGNARMGTQSFHFWDEGAIDFSLYQMVDLAKLSGYGAGTYSCSFDIQGGDGAYMDIYAYIKVTYNDGTTATTAMGNKVELTAWTEWHRTSASVDIADLSKVASIEVGIHVYAGVAQGTNGPWGNIDNAQFYFG